MIQYILKMPQYTQRKLGYILHECYVLNDTDNILKNIAWAAKGGMLFSNVTFHRRLKEENVGRTLMEIIVVVR